MSQLVTPEELEECFGTADLGHVSHAFTTLTPYYDRLMAPVPYQRWVDYLEKMWVRLRITPEHILDLACGTGNVSFELARRGYRVCGVDLSPGMIAEARRKQAASYAFCDVSFYNQDVAELNLPFKFDVATCLYDSLNYITDEQRLATAMVRIYDHLKDGAYFIFDVNAEYAFLAELFSQDNLIFNEDVKYLWRSRFDVDTRLCHVEMYFQIDGEDGAPLRFREVHCERYYSTAELTAMAELAGFIVTDVFDAYSFKRQRDKSERLFYVLRRPE